MPTKPTTLPIWATNAGSNVVTGLAIDNINWQTGTTSTVRYTFTGSPDLSAVIVGHQLMASSCTDDTHNGTFEITAVNNASDWIDVVNAAVTDATLDEASSPGTAIAKTGTALIQEPTNSKQTMGWLNSERPPAGYFNWLTNLAYSWFSWLDGWATDTDTAIGTLQSDVAGLGTTTTVITTNTTAAVKNHYFVNAATRKTVTLPSTFAVGDPVYVTGVGTGKYFLKPAAGDTIATPNGVCPTDGAIIVADNQYTSIQVAANSANSSWIITGGSGTYTVRDYSYNWSLLAGSSNGFSDGTGSAAQFSTAISGTTIDSAGNLFVADQANHRIRKINSAGVVTTFAGSTSGSADGTGTAALLSQPQGITSDSAGNLWVCDSGNERIRKITSAGVVTTLAGSTTGSADGTGTAALFSNLQGITVDSAGNLFVADQSNERIRKITSAGVVTTFAGSTAGSADGTGTAALFNTPHGITIDSAGNLFVAESGNHRVRKVTSAGVVTTLAGSGSGYSDGTGTAAKFNTPKGITIDSAGNLFVADQANHRIRKITSAGVVTTHGGNGSGYSDGLGTIAQFNQPRGITVDSTGNLFVSDSANARIRRGELET